MRFSLRSLFLLMTVLAFYSFAITLRLKIGLLVTLMLVTLCCFWHWHDRPFKAIIMAAIIAMIGNWLYLSCLFAYSDGLDFEISILKLCLQASIAGGLISGKVTCLMWLCFKKIDWKEFTFEKRKSAARFCGAFLGATAFASITYIILDLDLAKRVSYCGLIDDFAAPIIATSIVVGAIFGSKLLANLHGQLTRWQTDHATRIRQADQTLVAG
jgi:hypothetical protein